MTVEFVPFSKLTQEQQDRACQQRPTLHLEPVVVHMEGAPSSGPDAKVMGLYHLQLGDQHTVLNDREMFVFLQQFEAAAAKLNRTLAGIV